MDSVPDQQTGGHEREFALADVSRMSLAELIGSHDGPLANSLRRLVDEQSRALPEVAAFGNYPQ
jgi:FXSXX-COOH protein